MTYNLISVTDLDKVTLLYGSSTQTGVTAFAAS